MTFQPVAVHLKGRPESQRTVCGRRPLGTPNLPLDGVHAVSFDRFREVTCRTCRKAGRKAVADLLARAEEAST